MRQIVPYMKNICLYAILLQFYDFEVLADIAIPYLMSRIVDVGIESGM